MTKAAKIILIDEDDKYLLLRRSNHPAFPNDPDLPGGTVEEGEALMGALLREVQEEIGITLDPETIEHFHRSADYDKGYDYHLYRARCGKRPKVNISWEHASYSWLDFDDFVSTARTATDRYMHMVYDALSQSAQTINDQ